MTIALMLSLFCLSLYAQTIPSESKDISPSALPYEFQGVGKADPFLPFSKKRAPSFGVIAGSSAQGIIEESKAPVALGGYDISEIRLSGMVKKGNEILAIVTVPDGKAIFLREGMRVGKQGAIVAKLVYEDRNTPMGIEKIRRMIIRSPSSRPSLDYEEIEISIDTGTERKKQ